ncbi:hypothetical protein AAEO50_07400 [Rossellomorea oryzaecorticis]|uniref:Uncharacterized protein n=1 Tax=Rossellomorea oryzaecorticis TaxID=1396505 RepID=A0ABU9K7Q5_9BACI
MNAKKEFKEMKYLLENELLPMLSISREYSLYNLFIFQEMFKRIDNKDDLKSHFFLGIYLGEFLLGNFENSGWKIEKNDYFYDWKVTIFCDNDTSLTLFPCRRARKYLNNEDYDLISYVEGIKYSMKDPNTIAQIEIFKHNGVSYNIKELKDRLNKDNK